VQYYSATTAIAALSGLLWFNAFSFAFAPLDMESRLPNSTAADTSEGDGGSMLDTLLNFGFDLVPDNLFEVLLHTELLGLITFAIFFASALDTRTESAAALLALVGACGDTFVAMIKRVILLTPIGVGSLVAGSIARAVDVGQVFSALGALLGVVVVAQLVHVFVSDAALYALLTRRNPYRYYIGLPRAWFTAFGTSSSAATLSTTTECVVALGVSEDVARFVLPIGCTVNMDGSALERPITVLWIASVSGVPLSAARQLVVAVTSALLSLGASPIPSAGVSTLVVMIEQAGLPFTPPVLLATSFCLAVEWLLDSIRTSVNVTGDAVGAAIIDHRCRTPPNTARATRGTPTVTAVAGPSWSCTSAAVEFAPSLQEATSPQGPRPKVLELKVDDDRKG